LQHYRFAIGTGSGVVRVFVLQKAHADSGFEGHDHGQLNPSSLVKKVPSKLLLFTTFYWF
jgi:hypothetical protein